jgi:hypothetical protein
LKYEFWDLSGGIFLAALEGKFSDPGFVEFTQAGLDHAVVLSIL